MDEDVTEKRRRSHLKLKSLFKYLSNPVFTLQSFLEVHKLNSALRCLCSMIYIVTINYCLIIRIPAYAGQFYFIIGQFTKKSREIERGRSEHSVRA
jgi:hypothetical protein